MATFCVIENDQEISKVIWPSFKDSLEDKHNNAGKIGSKGEDSAGVLLMNSVLFPYNKYVIKHNDALSQMMGIDYTVIDVKGGIHLIDVKSGSSALYWTKEDGWYITLKPDWFSNTNKKTEIFMHLGPKGDVFAYYNLNDLLEWLMDNHALLSESKYGKILNKRDWPKNIIRTNLNENFS